MVIFIESNGILNSKIIYRIVRKSLNWIRNMTEHARINKIT